jgi:hypothetical protein
MTAITDCDVFEVSTPELHDVVGSKIGTDERHENGSNVSWLILDCLIADWRGRNCAAQKALTRDMPRPRMTAKGTFEWAV